MGSVLQNNKPVLFSDKQSLQENGRFPLFSVLQNFRIILIRVFFT